MKLILSHLRAMFTVVAITALTTAFADSPIPITAEEAFDAVQMQVDPETGTHANVVLVDVRDPGEYFWSGAPVAVTRIHLLEDDEDDDDENAKSEEVVPDWGKVRLVQRGKFVEYRVDGCYQRTEVAEISYLETEPIAVNIPLKIGMPPEWTKNPDFEEDVEGLAENYDTLILYCRTGGRSSSAALLLDNGLFTGVYEIDDPEGENMHGGFSGPSYEGAYNGYVGFPGRLTDHEDPPSVSWSDSGLPIATTVHPILLP